MGNGESREPSDPDSGGSSEATSRGIEDRRRDAVNVAVGVGMAVVAATVATGMALYSKSGSDSSTDQRKTMKAPGMSHRRIFRDEFEDDPAEYFRSLRKK